MNTDYIMRMIEQFIKALVGIVRSRKEGNYEEAFGQIQEASQFYLNEDISFLMRSNPKELLAHFTSEEGSLNLEKSMICAELLYEMALISELQKFDDVSLRLKILSIYLYTSAIMQDKQLQTKQYIEKVSSLIKSVNFKILPEYILKKIHLFQTTFKE